MFKSVGIFLKKICNFSKIVLVLLSASVERVGVSRMKDFCIGFFPNWRANNLSSILTTIGTEGTPVIDYFHCLKADFSNNGGYLGISVGAENSSLAVDPTFV